MDSATFHTLLKNATALLPEEVAELREWNSQYPYCQPIHLLLARGARDTQGADAQALLNRAAVYAGDRTVVKWLMTALSSTRVVVPVIKAVKKETIQPAPDQVASQLDQTPPVEAAKERISDEAPTSVAPSEPITLEGDALRADLDSELHRLHHLMSAFEASYEQLKQSEPAAAPAKSTKKPAGTKSTPPTPPAEAPEAPLIEEIKSSKRKPKLVSPKVAEQGEIIDHFIKVAPTLPRTKPTEPSADLAAESVNYGDHIVSETLVEILLKQGKKAKAIEMLKKLIWKFPQKKAYFAAQIEALKS
ncbi:MAG: hypothetical protein JNN04_08360 [Cyclobacteriaceae bacterium]|nr:hypothetical protein [Cyclobacteriaceae bacterium]